MENEIKKLAYFDNLTGLPNRKLFMEVKINKQPGDTIKVTIKERMVEK